MLRRFDRELLQFGGQVLAARGVSEDEIKKVLEHVHRDLDARHKVFDKWRQRQEAERRVRKYREKLRKVEEPEGDR